MAKKRQRKNAKPSSVKMTVRIPGDIAARIGMCCVETGESVNRMLAWLADIGYSIINTPKPDLAKPRLIYEAWKEKHRTIALAQRKIGEANRKYRQTLKDEQPTQQRPSILTSELQKK